MFDELASKVAEAAQHWREVPLRERVAVLRRAGALLAERRELLLDRLRADGLSTALAENFAKWILRQGEAEVLEYGARQLYRATPNGGEHLVRRPDGVVALITPGNSATINSAPLFSILLAGNGVIHRAPKRDGGVRLIAEDCVQQALREASHPTSVVEVVTSKTRPLLERIYPCEQVDTIVFFGNARAGADVSSRGHASGKKVVLELEGSGTMIVWSDADIDAAVDSALSGFDFSTQPCPIPKHFLVHPEIEQLFIEQLAERARALQTVEADPERGPLVPLYRPERYDDLVEEARGRGQLECGGDRITPAGEIDPSGHYGAPCLARIPHDETLGQSPLFCEEINVPVLPVVSYAAFTEDDEDILDAMLSLIDGAPFGLRASLWTQDEQVMARFISRIADVGLLIINGHHAQHPRYLSPWGGPKRSGGVHGESHQFWQKTSHLQGVIAPASALELALRGPPDKLRYELREDVAWLQFNRPERHNAVDFELAEQLSDALERAIEDSRAGRLRALVLHGAGRSFCSGADLSMLRELDARRARRFMQGVTWSFRLLEQLPIPTLALVRGYCMGGGFEIAMHCDAIIAGESARFALPEVLHGLTPTTGVVGRLVRAVGKQRAARWVLGGARIDAAEAEAAGLLSARVPDEQLEEAAQTHLEAIRARPPGGYAALKRMLVGLGQPDTASTELEAFEKLMRERGS